MTHLSQKKAPLMDALTQYKKNRIVPFDVPGHKHRLGDGPGGVHRDDPPIRVQRLFNAPHKELLEDNT